MLSFVYDISDLYKAVCTVPAAISVAGKGYTDLSAEVRSACRKLIRAERILKRIPEDIAWIFDQTASDDPVNAEGIGDLWNGEEERIDGGWNHGGE